MTARKTAFLSLFLILIIVPVAAGQQGAERDQIPDRQKKLAARIKTLRQEQDFLLFQKVLYSSDSKYLLLDVRGGKGQLRYKNRLLKDFSLSATGDSKRRVQRGGSVLTKKIEGPRERYALVFDKTVILQPKGAAAYREAGIPRISLRKRDFNALYYALERGARLYILP